MSVVAGSGSILNPIKKLFMVEFNCILFQECQIFFLKGGISVMLFLAFYVSDYLR